MIGGVQETVARYFEMWNTGDTSIAAEVLSTGWVDHAHPEMTGPDDVARAVTQTREARPGLRFDIEAILGGDADLVAVAGTAHVGTGSPTRLMWLIRMSEGRLAEMWTYTSPS